MEKTKQVVCIDNTDAEEELMVGQLYEVYVSSEFDEFYILNNQPYLKTRFKNYER